MKITPVTEDFLPFTVEPAEPSFRFPWWWALAFAALAAFLMPRQSAFPFSYQTGQPWNYAALKAPFDFEVLYPEEQVRPALAQIQAEHAPYFLLNADITRRQKRLFTQLLEEQIRISSHDAQFDDLRANAGVYMTFGQHMLDLLYTHGIVDVNDPIFKSTPGFVFVVDGQNERRMPVRELLTRSSANDFITDTLPYAALRQPEMVLPMLEKVLTPNLQYSDSLTTTSLHRKQAAAMSTGVTVHRGETIVQRNDVVSGDVYLKLQSLARRYENPKGWEVSSGYGLLAALAFGVFFLWFTMTYDGALRSREALLLLPVLALLCVLGVGFGAQIGAAVPLLLPFWMLPLLLRRAYGSSVGLGVWGLVIVLTTVSLDWSAGWLVIQAAGLVGALLLLLRAESWRARGVAVAAIALLQTLAGLAAGMAGKIPDAIWTFDSIVFLFVSAVFSLLTIPLGNFMARQL